MSQLHEMGTVENSEYPATPLAPVIVTPPVGYVPDTPAVDGYVIDYPISDAMMASNSSVTTYITIPKKGILSMPFTSQGSDAIGKFSLQEAVTYVSPALRVWVSLTPAGESVSNMLSAENALLLTEFRWTNTGVDEGIWGGIEPYTQYYFNVQHMDPEHPASVTKREVTAFVQGVVVGLAITDAEMSKTAKSKRILDVPAKGAILVEEFTTTSSTTSYGEFVLH